MNYPTTAEIRRAHPTRNFIRKRKRARRKALIAITIAAKAHRMATTPEQAEAAAQALHIAKHAAQAHAPEELIASAERKGSQM